AAEGPANLADQGLLAQALLAAAKLQGVIERGNNVADQQTAELDVLAAKRPGLAAAERDEADEARGRVQGQQQRAGDLRAQPGGGRRRIAGATRAGLGGEIVDWQRR